MDGNQTSPISEKQVQPVESSGQISPEGLEAKPAPAQVEAAQSGVKTDDGMAAAQAQVAAVTADDHTIIAQPATDPVGSAATPPLAADVDVIEPEWVKKAEEVVAKHRDDPHEQEDAVGALQIDYLKKRYNLDVKAGDEKP